MSTNKVDELISEVLLLQEKLREEKDKRRSEINDSIQVQDKTLSDFDNLN